MDDNGLVTDTRTERMVTIADAVMAATADADLDDEELGNAVIRAMWERGLDIVPVRLINPTDVVAYEMRDGSRFQWDENTRVFEVVRPAASLGQFLNNWRQLK